MDRKKLYAYAITVKKTSAERYLFIFYCREIKDFSTGFSRGKPWVYGECKALSSLWGRPISSGGHSMAGMMMTVLIATNIIDFLFKRGQSQSTSTLNVLMF